MERPEGDARTGVFTSAVVSVVREAAAAGSPGPARARRGGWHYMLVGASVQDIVNGNAGPPRILAVHAW